MDLLIDLFYTKIAYADVDSFIRNVDRLIINPIIILLFALAIVIFLYGVLEFLLGQASEEKKTTGKSHMLWGIVGITIMLGVWTIMNLLLNTLQIRGIRPEQGEVQLR